MTIDTKEEIKISDFVNSLKQYEPSETITYPTDILDNRYRLILNQPIAELSSEFAKAYGATDAQTPNAEIYVLVYNNNCTLRQKNIDVLSEFRHPNIVALLANGKVQISIFSEVRFVVIVEKPKGQPLSKLLLEGRNAANNAVSEVVLFSYLLRPIVDILRELNKLGISHNRINLSNVYLGQNSIMLGECVSEPAGYSQDFVFEPIDRILTLPLAKSDYDISADCYAIAVLSLHLLLGFQPFFATTKEDFINDLLTKGVYHTLVIEWDLSDNVNDLFRGLLNDTRLERRDPDNIELWLAGRHFNLITPSLLREAARGFEFMEKAYFNRKSIANTIFVEWQESRSILLDQKLGKWVDTAVHKSDVAEAILRISGSDMSRSEKQINDALARLIMILDPNGPIRYKNISVSVEGIPTLLAHSLLTNNQEFIQNIVQIIESDLTGFWIELHKNTSDYTTVIAKLQKIRNFMRMNAYGFGIERCIYDICPTLPCQSPLVKRYNVTTLDELLIILDKIANEKGANDDFIDRHIAGFIGSKLELAREVNLSEVSGVPELSKNNRLLALKLLVRAQQKISNNKLAGLGLWIAVNLAPLFSNIHRRSQRKQLSSSLKTAAISGSLKAISDIFLNPDVFVSDYESFQHAKYDYSARKKHISELKNNTILVRHSRMAGRGIAQTVAYSACLFTVYYTLKSHFHF